MKTQFADSTKVVEFVPHILDLKRILVPVDFSETSKKAFLYALKFAEQFSCEITLLIVVQPMSPMVGAPLAVEAFSDAEDEFSEAERSLAMLAAESHANGANSVNSSVRIGHAPNEITKAAKDLDIDLIIIATHGYTSWRHLCIGSTAERVVRTAAVSRAGGPREGARVHLANSERFGENEVETKFYNRNRTTSHPRGAASFSGRDGSHAARPAYRLRNRCSLVGGEPTCVGFVVSSSKLAFLCMILHRNGFTRQTSRFMYARISGCVSWLNRSHSMSDPPNITSDGDGLVAEFPITYALTNSKGTSSGTLRMTMHHKPQAQTWQVAGIQKEVIQATMKQ